ncbi:MAG: DUF6174 domain-containing protein [Bacteroidota bacterium]|nr:DUF6174 domain-containing protein [Candidatus Kapabacteria bacterium]MDW8220390.1 DUF6174 domain-containing protein [Bacteroidota bacterium]
MKTLSLWSINAALLISNACTALLLSCQQHIEGIRTPQYFSTVEAAEERWKAHAIGSYTLLQRRFCFCVRLQYPLTVHVRNGIVVGVRDARGDSLSPDFGSSVEDMFATIRSVQRLPDAKIDVRYDSVYGYPRYINADPLPYAADDEYVLETQLLR